MRRSPSDVELDSWTCIPLRERQTCGNASGKGGWESRSRPVTRAIGSCASRRSSSGRACVGVHAPATNRRCAGADHAKRTDERHQRAPHRGESGQRARGVGERIARHMAPHCRRRHNVAIGSSRRRRFTAVPRRPRRRRVDRISAEHRRRSAISHLQDDRRRRNTGRCSSRTAIPTASTTAWRSGTPITELSSATRSERTSRC